MSRKNVHAYAIFNAVDATSAQTSLSGPTDVSQVDKFNIHCKFSAANSGAFQVFVRNAKTSAFYELNFGASLAITSQTECLIDISQANFSDMYLVWTPSAGSGTLTAVLHMASVGA
jgi:hypothetical protein